MGDQAPVPRAFLVHANKVYAANESDLASPNTPVTLLIEAICTQYPHDSLRILRERIYTGEALAN